jgi:hypothetical protein
MKKHELVTIKIRGNFRDMAKDQSEINGMRMYRFIEEAIEKACKETNRMASQHVK